MSYSDRSQADLPCIIAPLEASGENTSDYDLDAIADAVIGIDFPIDTDTERSSNPVYYFTVGPEEFWGAVMSSFISK